MDEEREKFCLEIRNDIMRIADKIVERIVNIDKYLTENPNYIRVFSDCETSLLNLLVSELGKVARRIG